MSADSDRPYKVELMQPAREAIREGSRQAARLGIKRDFARTLKLILQDLSTRPLTWGDPTGELRAAQLQLFQRLVERMLVIYAVHEERRIVFLRDCRPVLGHPLESPD